METIETIIYIVFIILSAINCIVAKDKQNTSALYGWLSAIAMAIICLLNTLND